MTWLTLLSSAMFVVRWCSQVSSRSTGNIPMFDLYCSLAISILIQLINNSCTLDLTNNSRHFVSFVKMRCRTRLE